MHRYPAAAPGSSSGVPGGGGPPTARSSDPSFQNTSNFNFASRRTAPLQPYKLRCEREPLSARLGPPDFYPPTPNCAEEILNRDTSLIGYKEVIDGVEEGKEVLLTLTTSVALWSRPNVNHYKESIWKRLRELNNALIRKRKAGQVYGVPLSGPLLAKSGVFPEQRTCGEDFRKKWIEDLSQRKRLRALAEHVPHGYQRRTIFEALIKHDVPLLRATWFIKIIYLNQVKPMSIGMSAGGPDKSQSKRVELWTKNVLDYSQWLLDDLCQPGQRASITSAHSQKMLLFSTRDSAVVREPDVFTKWRYVVRLVQWHYTEGLLNRAQVVEWALKQLQEKESVEALELLLPLVLELIDGITLSQTHSRTLIELSLQWLRKLYPSGQQVPPTSDDNNSPHNQVADTLVHLLQYLLVVIPDTFVALDCFPLPHCVHLPGKGKQPRGDSLHGETNLETVVNETVDLIQRRTASLARAVSPTLLRNNEGRIVQALDKALEKGDVAGAYRIIYDEEFCSGNNLPADWRTDVVSRTAFNLSGPVNPSELYAVRFLCEWAVCDFRDIRGMVPKTQWKELVCRDMSRVYVAVSVLRMKAAERDPKSDSRFPVSRIHDLIYAWLDQHIVWQQGESSERLPLLLSELVREGLFIPEAYVKQLLCAEVLDKEVARASRHRHVLQHLPSPWGLMSNKNGSRQSRGLYRIERRLALDGLGIRRLKQQRTQEGQQRKFRILELKQVIAMSLQFPEVALSVLAKRLEGAKNTSVAASSGLKRLATAFSSNMEPTRDVPTPDCEECSRGVKRQKASEGKEWIATGSAIVEDDESCWWVKKGPPTKVVEISPIKVEASVKPTSKQTTRGRPKPVRKTQSLAQMATNRVDGNNQGGSNTHALEQPKVVSCLLHHHLSSEAGQLKDNNYSRMTGDLRALGEAMKRLRVVENRALVSWLDSEVHSLLTNSQGNLFPNPQSNHRLANGGTISNADYADRSTTWRLGEEQFATIVYIMDVGNDLHTLMKLLLWLLPIAGTSSGSTPLGHGIPAYAGGRDGSPCSVGETAILSSLQRYEAVLAAMDMLPQALSAAMQRAATVMAAIPGGRAGCSSLLYYVRDLLRKYGSLPCVQTWEKTWKASCDQRLRAELEALKAGDNTEGFGFGLVTSMGDDRDDPVVPRLTGRLSRIGSTMKDIVQRNVDIAMQSIISKEREGGGKDGGVEVVVFQAAHSLVVNVMHAIRQNSGGAPQADAALVAHAVFSIVNFAGSSVASVLENLGYNVPVETTATATSAVKGARRMLQFHIHCLQLLKSAIDDRQFRMLEVAIANESTTIVQTGIAHMHGRTPRSQFHLSPETPDTNPALTTDTFTRPTIAAAAVLALVTGLVVNGVTTLERMVSVLLVKDGLENLGLQKPPVGLGFSNGKPSNPTRVENLPEAHIHWFRVLIGDCRTVLGGLVGDLLGEATVLGLSRLQRSIPLVTVFRPAYAIFAVALRSQQQILNHREEATMQGVTAAANDMVAHEPFRDVCFRDTSALYRCISGDSGESEYAAMLDMQGLDLGKKVAAMVPLRARLFLHALLDRKMPDDGGQNRSHTSNGPGQIEQVVQILDELQAATFHWQWVELRLLLNEQVILEKLKLHPQSAQEAVQAAMLGPDRQQLDECEKTFTEIVLTRLLVRPDAAALYSEAVHLLGKALEDYLILHVKWVLENNDMLLGRKSLRHLLASIAAKGIPVRIRNSTRTWDWQPPKQQQPQRNSSNMDERKRGRAALPEEGELEDEAVDPKKSDLGFRPFATEKALADLVLPCLARSSMENHNGFAFELVKQMNNLEQHISNLTRNNNSGRTPASTTQPGDGVIGSKSASQARRRSRESMDIGSPGLLGRRLPRPETVIPVSPAALQVSLWLRLQFLLPLLPIILTERDQQSVLNKRHTLAPVLLRLLGTRVVQESATDPLFNWETSCATPLSDFKWNSQATSAAAAASASEPLFDRLLSILHALLSNTWAVWLKSRKGSVKPLRDIPPFDKEAAERMQVDVDHMQLPRGIRTRLQSVFPLLPSTPVTTVSAAPPQVPAMVVSQFQLRAPRNLYPLENNVSKSSKAVVGLPDSEMEVDPWTLLEDGVGASTGPIGGGEVGHLKACAWLKGAVRVRRTDLTYIGAVDEEP